MVRDAHLNIQELEVEKAKGSDSTTRNWHKHLLESIDHGKRRRQKDTSTDRIDRIRGGSEM